MDYSTSGFPVLHYLLEFAQTHVHRVGDAMQRTHPLLSHSLLAFNLSQHQGLSQWVNSSHEMTKVSDLQFQHQSSQWIFRVDCVEDWLVGSSCCSRDSSTTVRKHQFFGAQPSLWSNDDLNIISQLFLFWKLIKTHQFSQRYGVFQQGFGQSFLW